MKVSSKQFNDIKERYQKIAIFCTIPEYVPLFVSMRNDLKDLIYLVENTVIFDDILEED